MEVNRVTGVKNCPQCGRDQWNTSLKLFREWRESGAALCPPCLRKFRGPTTSVRTTLKCAGCGASSAHLARGVCQRCAANGVEALSLFGEAT